ncbi:MAG TPA: GrpB family protein [Actinomycetota bacterium]|nr:GrpB family protein [Actinomycetota bacterium]
MTRTGPESEPRAAGADLGEHLDAVLIGGMEPVIVELVDYRPEWPRTFESERNRLRAAVGPVARRIEHVGSTSVPRLAAKDVVDVVMTVDDVEQESYARPVEALGYALRVREPGHRCYRLMDPRVNLHVWGDDDPEVAKYLAFRDRLRAHDEDRALYERVKRDLAGREYDDVNFYADAKGEVIHEILARAERSGGRTSPAQRPT